MDTEPIKPKPYRANLFVRANNAVMRSLIRAGIRVRNLRAADVSLCSGPPGISRPIVRIFRRFFVLPYLDVDMDSPDDQFVRSAQNHPVFRLRPAVQR